MGPGELFALRPRDVQLAGGFVVVDGDLVEVVGQRPHIEETKNRFRRRRIDLPPMALDALRKRLKLRLAENPKVEQVFTSAEGTLIHMSNLRRRWWKPLLQRAAALAEKAAHKAGDTQYRFPTDLRMYDLRHTANALLSYIGVPLEVARERMGHASIRLTADTYGHIFPSMQRDVASRLQILFEKIRDDAESNLSQRDDAACHDAVDSTRVVAK